MARENDDFGPGGMTKQVMLSTTFVDPALAQKALNDLCPGQFWRGHSIHSMRIFMRILGKFQDKFLCANYSNILLLRVFQKGARMPMFTVLSRVDAYVDYLAEVEADTAEDAADLAYDGDPSIKWVKEQVVEFDARHVVTLDDEGNEIESTARGKG